MSLVILSNRHVNLHSKSTHGGLVHVPAGKKRSVPDDVKNHPGFEVLVEGGILSVLSSKTKAEPAVALKPPAPEKPKVEKPEEEEEEEEEEKEEEEE